MVKEAFKDFSRPAPAVDTVIFRVVDAEITTNRGVPRKSLQTLLIRRKNSDEKWHLPGTMLRLGEKSTDALNRILVDKAQINDLYFEQLYTVDDNPMRDERGHIISIVYIGVAKEHQQIQMREDSVYESRWFWVSKYWMDNITGQRIFKAEDSEEQVMEMEYDHLDIFNDALTRIQGKLKYTDLLFEFMDKTFTLKELENSYEAIVMKHSSSFRRTFTPKIESLGIRKDGGAFRPPEVFKKKE